MALVLFIIVTVLTWFICKFLNRNTVGTPMAYITRFVIVWIIVFGIIGGVIGNLL